MDVSGHVDVEIGPIVQAGHSSNDFGDAQVPDDRFVM